MKVFKININHKRRKAASKRKATPFKDGLGFLRKRQYNTSRQVIL